MCGVCCVDVGNPDRWWVATQDKALRAELEQVPGCPLVFATINGIHLHQPHELSRQQAKQVRTLRQPGGAAGQAAGPDLDALLSTPASAAVAVGRQSEAGAAGASLCARAQASIAQQAVPAHERQTDVLKDLDEIQPKLRTKNVFRRNKAKVRRSDASCRACAGVAGRAASARLSH